MELTSHHCELRHIFMDNNLYLVFLFLFIGHDLSNFLNHMLFYYHAQKNNIYISLCSFIFYRFILLTFFTLISIAKLLGSCFLYMQHQTDGVLKGMVRVYAKTQLSILSILIISIFCFKNRK